MRHGKLVAFAVVLAMLASAAQATAKNIRNADRGTCVARPEPARPNPSVARHLASLVSDGRSPGLIAAILDRCGIRSIAAAGVRKQGSHEKITVGDLIHIGSNTKAMTSVMLAQLVTQGVFPSGWQTTIGEVFPELNAKIHPDYQSVSLNSLIKMRGGIARNAFDWQGCRNCEIKKKRYLIVRRNLKKRPNVKAGIFQYSNLSYVIAGAMAERLTGKAWEQLMIERVFTPLGMRAAGFGPPGQARKIFQPWGHRRGRNRNWRPRQFDNPAAIGPAGTVHLPIADYARFVKLWFRGTEPANLVRDRLDYLSALRSGNYAAGWLVLRRNWGKGVVLTHSGSNTYWWMTVWVAPNLGRAYLAVANSAERGTHRMIDAIIQRLIEHGK